MYINASDNRSFTICHLTTTTKKKQEFFNSTIILIFGALEFTAVELTLAPGLTVLRFVFKKWCRQSMLLW